MSGRIFGLVIRGPCISATSQTLPEAVYRKIMKESLEQLRKGFNCYSVVDYILDELRRKAVDQEKLPGLIPDEDNMGPMNGFGAIALDRDGTMTALHKSHPNSLDRNDLVEDHGYYVGESGCLSIASTWKVAKKAVESLKDNLEPYALKKYINDHADGVPLAGILMTRSGKIGVATKTLTPFAIGHSDGKEIFGIHEISHMF